MYHKIHSFIVQLSSFPCIHKDTLTITTNSRTFLPPPQRYPNSLTMAFHFPLSSASVCMFVSPHRGRWVAYCDCIPSCIAHFVFLLIG